MEYSTPMDLCTTSNPRRIDTTTCRTTTCRTTKLHNTNTPNTGNEGPVLNSRATQLELFDDVADLLKPVRVHVVALDSLSYDLQWKEEVRSTCSSDDRYRRR